ncbi:MAG: hypothetical protein LUG86_09020 [Oscillospiraceae bacterium]|nr:hypothetical protein [Oscillospiraceae bacterium]
MTKLTKDQQKKIMNETQEILDSLSEGKSTRDVMAEIYVKNLEDKTIKQGEVMADAILESIKEFDSSYEHAKNNVDGFIESFQKKANTDKTPAERCTYWLRFTATLSAITLALGEGTITEEKKNEIVSQVEALSVSEAEATQEYELQLMAEAKEAMLNSNILLVGMMNSTDEVAGAEDTDEVTELLISLGSKEIEFRGIMSMLVYTKLKSGEYGKDAADMTPEQVATMVCAQVEEARILDAVGKGSITERLAAELFRALGIVVIGTAMAFLTFAVGFPVYILLAGICGLMCPPLFDWVVCSVFFYGLWKLISVAYNGWEKVNGKAFNAIKAGLKNVGLALGVIVTFGRDHIILPAIEYAKKHSRKQKTAETDEDVIIVGSEEVDEDATVETPGEAVLA